MLGHQTLLLAQHVPPPGESPQSGANWYAALLYVLVGAVIVILLYLLERRQRTERWRKHLPEELKPDGSEQAGPTEERGHNGDR